MREKSTGQLHYVVMLTRVICELRYEVPVSDYLALSWVDIDPLYFRPACDFGLQCVPIASRFDFPELGSEQLLTTDRTLIPGASRRPLLMVPRKHGMPGLSLWKVDKPQHDDRTTRLSRVPARRPDDLSEQVHLSDALVPTRP